MTAEAIPRERVRHRGPSFWERLWESRLAYVYILPAGFVMLVITFFPLIYQVWMSLTDYALANLRTQGFAGLIAKIIGSFSATFSATHPEATSPSFVGTENYVRILTNDLALPGFDFWYMLSFNLIWTFVNVFFHVVLGVAFAMLLNKKDLAFKRFYRAFYIIPWALPALISGMIWRNMFDKDYGAINLITKLNVDWINETTEPLQKGLNSLAASLSKISPGVSTFYSSMAQALDGLSSWLYYLIAFGVIGLIGVFFWLVRRYDAGLGLRVVVTTVGILLGIGALLMIGWDLPYAFYAVLLANIWLGWPFMMTVATGALQGISAELYEAATIDGASGWQSFWQITVPLLRPAMVPAIMIGMMMTFNQFNVVFFVTGGAPLHRTEILVTQAFRLINEQYLYGVAAAFSFVVFVVLAIITMITNRISRATESYAT